MPTGAHGNILTIKEHMIAIGGYRLSIDLVSNRVCVAFPFTLPRPHRSDNYGSIDNAPRWMQERVAVLMMFDVEDYSYFHPPEVEGVGCRIGDSEYWICPPDASDLLTKPRKEN